LGRQNSQVVEPDQKVPALTGACVPKPPAIRTLPLANKVAEVNQSSPQFMTPAGSQESEQNRRVLRSQRAGPEPPATSNQAFCSKVAVLLGSCARKRGCRIPPAWRGQKSSVRLISEPAVSVLPATTPSLGARGCSVNCLPSVNVRRLAHNRLRDYKHLGIKQDRVPH